MSKFRALLLAHHRSSRSPPAGRPTWPRPARARSSTAAGAAAAAAPAAAAGGGGTPAASCPAGTIDRGVVGTAAAPASCRPRFNDDTTIQNLPGVALFARRVRSMSAPIAAATPQRRRRRQPVTLTIQAGHPALRAPSGNDYLVVNRGSRLNAVGTAGRADHLHRPRQCRRHRDRCEPGPVGRHHPARPRADLDCNTAVAGRLGHLPAGDRGHDQLALRRRLAERQFAARCNIVQIRYSGFAIAPGNELQGLTMGGVGQLHHDRPYPDPQQLGRRHRDFRRPAEPQASSSITGADDDGLDTDLGYRGTIQFVIGVQRDARERRFDDRGRFERQRGRAAAPIYPRLQRDLRPAQHRPGRQHDPAARRHRLCAAQQRRRRPSNLPRHRRDRRHHHPRRRRGAAGSRPAGLPLGACSPARPPSATTATSPSRRSQRSSASGTNNNNRRSRPTLTSVFINGANETAVAATDPTPFNADPLPARPAQRGGAQPVQPRSPISARSRTRPTLWYAGWTCNSGYVELRRRQRQLHRPT